MPRIALLSTSDTDLLSARASGANYVWGNPSRLDVTGTDPGSLHALLHGADLVIVRILGSARSWQEGLDQALTHGVPVVVLGGEQTPDAELMSHSTVPVGIAAAAHGQLAYGGPDNLAALHAFLSSTVLLTGGSVAPPTDLPECGLPERSTPPQADRDGLPRIGILSSRAHQASGNTRFVHD